MITIHCKCGHPEEMDEDILERSAFTKEDLEGGNCLVCIQAAELELKEVKERE